MARIGCNTVGFKEIGLAGEFLESDYVIGIVTGSIALLPPLKWHQCLKSAANRRCFFMILCKLWRSIPAAWAAWVTLPPV